MRSLAEMRISTWSFEPDVEVYYSLRRLPQLPYGTRALDIIIQWAIFFAARSFYSSHLRGCTCIELSSARVAPDVPAIFAPWGKEASQSINRRGSVSFTVRVNSSPSSFTMHSRLKMHVTCYRTGIYLLGFWWRKTFWCRSEMTFNRLVFWWTVQIANPIRE